MKTKLTKRMIDGLQAPAKGRKTVYDTVETGLAVQVTPTGVKTFYVVKWHTGRVHWVRLGSVEEMTLDNARTAARDVRSDIRANLDPNAIKRQARDEATLQDLFAAYLEHHARPHNRPRSVGEYERLYQRHLARWSHKRLAEITPELVDTLKTRIGQDAPSEANRLLALLSVMFRKCGFRFGLARNWTPTAGLERFREHARDRVLTPEEMTRLLATLKTWSNKTYTDYFTLCILTGARRGNVASMRWDDIDLDRRIWKVPGEVTKNGSPLTVALVDEAVTLLQKRPDHSPYVFAGKAVTQEQVGKARGLHATGKSTRYIAGAVGVSQTQVMRMLEPEFVAGVHRPLNGIGKAWKKIVAAAGITERTTVHDLRRSFASAMIEAGAALPHVAAALGHKTQQTTLKHYIIAGQDKTRAAVAAGVAKMLNTPAGKPVQSEQRASA